MPRSLEEVFRWLAFRNDDKYAAPKGLIEGAVDGIHKEGLYAESGRILA